MSSRVCGAPSWWAMITAPMKNGSASKLLAWAALARARIALQDDADGVTRLLLITRYGDHGVWEKSRDPSTAAMAAFARRQLLTRDSWAASTLFVPV